MLNNMTYIQTPTEYIILLESTGYVLGGGGPSKHVYAKIRPHSTKTRLPGSSIDNGYCLTHVQFMTIIYQQNTTFNHNYDLTLTH